MKSVRLYFATVVVLTIPIWILGSVLDFHILPGLPIAAMAVICPALAAIMLSYRAGGIEEVRSILARVLDAKKAGWRMLPVALTNPALFALAYFATLQMGSDIPSPQFTPIQVLALFALFFPAAMLEEIGWTAYATERLQAGSSPLIAGLVLGLFWALWHYPALFQAGRSIDWIAWWTLWTIAARVVMVWLFNWVGASLFALALYHGLSNVCWQLYPVNGTYFDPKVSGLITLGLAAALTAWSLLVRRRAT